MKSESRENKIYLALLLIFIVVFSAVTILYLVKKNNTSIILQGEPKDIVLENFNGDADFNVVTVSAYDGSIRNEDAVSFTLMGKQYYAQPGELSIDFGQTYSAEANFYRPGSISDQYMFLHSDPLSGESSYADKITIRYDDRIIEYDRPEDMQPDKLVTQYIVVQLTNFHSDGIFRIGSGDPLSADDNTGIRFKDKVLSASGGDILLNQDCRFSFDNVSLLELVLSDDSDDFYLNGKIKGLSGTLGNDDAALYCTTGASQSSFFCGNQSLLVEGNELIAEYEYASPSADLVVNGKPTAARLEGIDIREGFVQYLVTNFDSFFFAFFGALLALVIDKTLKKE